MGRDFSHPSLPALGLPSRAYNAYRLSFPGLKRPGRGVNHTPLSSAEVKERVELTPLLLFWGLMACSGAKVMR